jgi:multidrug resistance efflux pump
MEKGFAFKFIRIVIVLGVSLSVAWWLIKMQPKPSRYEQTDTGRLVEVFRAKAKDLNMMIETYGTVKPREALKLVAEVTGQIVDINRLNREGCFVEQGDVLIKIDPRAYQLEVRRKHVQISQTLAELKRIEQEIQNLKASIKIAKSNSDLTLMERRRLKLLSWKKAVARTSLDNAEQKYLASLERLQSLENQLALTGPRKEELNAQKNMAYVMLKKAMLDVERTEIVAPFGGWIIDRAVEKGQHVNAGQYLGEIYRDRSFDIEVRIPFKDLKWLPIKNKSYDETTEAEIIFNSSYTPEKKMAWKGRVARIKAGMDEKTRTLPVVVEVDSYNPDGVKQEMLDLRPGMFVTVLIKGIKKKGIFVIPRHLVHSGNLVYIAEQDRLRIRQVSVMRNFKDYVYINQGISEHDLIIKTLLSGVSDQMKIRIKRSGSGFLQNSQIPPKKYDLKPKKIVY